VVDRVWDKKRRFEFEACGKEGMLGVPGCWRSTSSWRWRWIRRFLEFGGVCVCSVGSVGDAYGARAVGGRGEDEGMKECREER